MYKKVKIRSHQTYMVSGPDSSPRERRVPSFQCYVTGSFVRPSSCSEHSRVPSAGHLLASHCQASCNFNTFSQVQLLNLAGFSREGKGRAGADSVAGPVPFPKVPMTPVRSPLCSAQGSGLCAHFQGVPARPRERGLPWGFPD